MPREELDKEHWIAAISSAPDSPLETARATYEKFLQRFPTAARYWKWYAEHEAKEKNYDRAEKVLLRCLVACPNIELWKLYLKFTQTTKLELPGELEGDELVTAREEVQTAFEFAEEHMGLSIFASTIWTDHIVFVKSAEELTAFDKGQKVTAIRKLYHRALQIPMHNMVSLWKEYEAFENEHNPALAKAFLTEIEPNFLAVKAVYRDMRSIWEKLQLQSLATQPIEKPVDSGNAGAMEQYEREHAQFLQWNKLLDYERENHLHLDEAALRSRVRHVFKHALCYVRFYPEAWHSFFHYEQDSGNIEAAGKVCQCASQALPCCLFINFMHADFLEGQKRIEEAHRIYTRLQSEVGGALVDIRSMQFARRTCGVDAARQVFKTSRERDCAYQVFVAAALLEFYANKDEKVARNIFELGFRRFSEEPGFVLEYIDFLSHRSDDNNIRVLFERSLHVLPPEKAKPVWDKFLTFEHAMARGCGDLAAVKRLETRRMEAYPSDASLRGLMGLAHRYGAVGLAPDTGDDSALLQRFGAGNKAGDKAQNAPVSALSTPGAGAPLLGRPGAAAGRAHVPHFLSRLVSLLPPRAALACPMQDVSYVMRMIAELPLPQRPVDHGHGPAASSPAAPPAAAAAATTGKGPTPEGAPRPGTVASTKSTVGVGPKGQNAYRRPEADLFSARSKRRRDED